MNCKIPLVKLALFTFTIIFSSSCASIRPATNVVQDSIQRYRYVCITSTQNLSSRSGSKSGNMYYSVSKSANPVDVISGKPSRIGLIRLPEIKHELSAQKLVVHYGESGKINLFLRYAMKVTIKFINAQPFLPACTCTAKGNDLNEADDVREAIDRCIENTFQNNALNNLFYLLNSTNLKRHDDNEK